jgi:hypothetical protein
MRPNNLLLALFLLYLCARDSYAPIQTFSYIYHHTSACVVSLAERQSRLFYLAESKLSKASLKCPTPCEGSARSTNYRASLTKEQRFLPCVCTKELNGH